MLCSLQRRGRADHDSRDRARPLCPHDAAAGAFFTELAGVMRDCVPDKAALNRFGAKWQVEFLGPPLSLADQST
jgi:hypothetical protein